MIYPDTNVILRYLLQDSKELGKQSKEYMEKYTVFIKNEVLAEVVYVLNKTYQVPRDEIANVLKELILCSNTEMESKKVAILALDIYETQNIDFVDSLLCTYSKILDFNVVSFDKKLNKCKR